MGTWKWIAQMPAGKGVQACLQNRLVEADRNNLFHSRIDVDGTEA